MKRLLLAALLAGCGHLSHASPLSEKLVVAGEVRTSLTLTVDDLRAFPADQISTVTLTRKIDGKEQSTRLRGVRLAALLQRAGVLESDHNAAKRMVVLASATDGYRVAFSWLELINTEVGAGALVIFERDGRALDEGEGRMALISARDQRAGPRHVKWLDKIELRLLP